MSIILNFLGVEKDDLSDDDVLEDLSQLMIERGAVGFVWEIEITDEEEELEPEELGVNCLRAILIFNDANEELELSSSVLDRTRCESAGFCLALYSSMKGS